MSNKEKASNSDEAQLLELFKARSKTIKVFPQLGSLPETQLDVLATYAEDLLVTGGMSANATLAALNEALDEYAIELAARSKDSSNAEGIPTLDVSQEPEKLYLTLDALRAATTEKSEEPNTANVRRVELPYRRHPMNSLKATVLRALAFTQ